MNEDHFEAFLHASSQQGSKLGLERMKKLMKNLGNPEKHLKFIHVAGTNGKGSFTALLSSILTSAGYKTGVYISPHLVSYCERMVIDGVQITEEELFRLADYVRSHTDQMQDKPTEFELLTGMALCYFASQNCDIVLLEVGLGGRLDATNIIPSPELAVIMNIGFDHVQMLGDTLGKIAAEKSGIVKENCTVITYPGVLEVESVYRETCKQRNASWHKVNLDKMTFLSEGLSGQTFHWGSLLNLSIHLLGEHQRKNAAVALEAVELLQEKGWNISDQAIRSGLSKARWPARMEILHRNPLIILDGAHNDQCAFALSNSLANLFPKKKIVFLSGVLADKDYRKIMKRMIPLAQEFFCLTPLSDRALSAVELAAHLKKCGAKATACNSTKDGIGKAIKAAGKDGVVVAFGSLYLAGNVRRYFFPKIGYAENEKQKNKLHNHANAPNGMISLV